MPAFTLQADILLQDLRDFIAAEFAAQRLKFAEQRAKPRSERVEYGTCMERPIVFLLGLDDLFAEETNPLHTDEERAEQRLAITRQIYVGITRAMERVVIYSDHASLRLE